VGATGRARQSACDGGRAHTWVLGYVLRMVTPDPARIRAFKSARAFEAWMRKHHDQEPELYLRVYKKDSGVASVTIKEALDVVLCWGWIDGLRKPHDAESYLQRYTPRRSKGLWSQINREHVARLIAAGRMTEHGLKHVEAAKADGRWDKAYAGGAKMEMPADLVEAIRAEPRALAHYRKLDRANLYALAWRVNTLKTAAGRARRIAAFVEMLKAGKTVHPVK
jgi:uncharacterized protein YdeI (YjbR/CyaY-like superfamily)